MTEERKDIYVLGPVRKASPEQSAKISKQVEFRESQGHVVYNPVVNAPQQDKTGYNIVMSELDFLYRRAPIVDILWNLGGIPSEGSRVDIGMALGLNLELNLVETFNKDCPTIPQVSYRIIQEKITETPKKPTTGKAHELLAQMEKDGEAVIDWNVDMIGEAEEWQRIRLGLALACFSQNPNFKIKMGNLVGIDPPDKKSYPKVIAELMKGETF